MLTDDQLQTLTLKASYVYAHADTPYFINEINHMARRLGEPAFLNFFVRYRSDKEDETRHRWSRVNAVVYLSERESRLVKSCAGTATAGAGGGGGDDATPSSIQSTYPQKNNNNISSSSNHHVITEDPTSPNHTGVHSETPDAALASSAPSHVHQRAGRAGVQLTIDAHTHADTMNDPIMTNSRVHVDPLQPPLVSSLPNKRLEESIVWRNKRFWVGLLVEGEDQVVYLPRLSAKPPTEEEVMEFCVHQANHHPEQVYAHEETSRAANSGTHYASENGPTSATETASSALMATPLPRHYLPTAQQMEKLKSYRLQRITQHQWTPEEIREMRVWKQRASELENTRVGERHAATAAVVTAAAATPVESTLHRIQNMKLETELRRSLHGVQQVHNNNNNNNNINNNDAMCHSSQQDNVNRNMPHNHTHVDRMNTSMSDIALPCFTAPTAAPSPLYRPNTPVSPFLPRRLLRRMSDVGSESSSASASLSFAPIGNTSTMHSSTHASQGAVYHTHVSRADANSTHNTHRGNNNNNNDNDNDNDSSSNNPNRFGQENSIQNPSATAAEAAAATAATVAARFVSGNSDASLSLSLSLGNHSAEASANIHTSGSTGAGVVGADTVRRWERAVEQESAFFAYVSESQRCAYLNKISDISRRNSVENRRNRLRGIANERRLERKGNLLESGGLWVTNDKERARKAAEYKESQDDHGKGGGGEAGGGGGAEAKKAAANAVHTPATPAPLPTAEEVFLENFRRNHAEQRMCFAETDGWWWSAPPVVHEKDTAVVASPNRRRARSEERKGEGEVEVEEKRGTVVGGASVSAAPPLSAEGGDAMHASSEAPDTPAPTVVAALKGSTRYRLVREEGVPSVASSRIVTAQLLHSSATSMARGARVPRPRWEDGGSTAPSSSSS